MKTEIKTKLGNIKFEKIQNSKKSINAQYGTNTIIDMKSYYPDKILYLKTEDKNE